MNKWLGVLAVAALGCDPIGVSTLRQQIGDSCPPDGCFNSPLTEIPEVGSHEFNLSGQPNGNGIVVVPRIFKGGKQWGLVVEDGRIRGAHGTNGPLGGEHLEGAEIVFQGQKSPFAVHIYRVETRTFAVGSPDTFEAYQLGWHAVGEPPEAEYQRANKVCADPNQIGGEDGYYQLLGLELGESVVFEGDRIDAEAKTIDSSWDPSWFTVGCAGTALAKLFLLRQTTVSSNGQSTPEERGAHLKMLAADYCGDGTSFTMPGEPLLWRSTLMDFPDPSGNQTTPHQLEARWTSHGAMCLSIPRLEASSLPHTFGDVEAAIFAHCPELPICSKTDAWDFDGATLVTANPPPSPP